MNVPGLGEALAVFCFEEEAMFYLGYGDDDSRPRPVGADELMVLLLGSWSRFELITLDPMPQSDAGIMLRLATMHRDDFLDYLVARRWPGRWIHDGDPQTARKRRRSLGHTRPDPGLVGGSPAPE